MVGYARLLTLLLLCSRMAAAQVNTAPNQPGAPAPRTLAFGERPATSGQQVDQSTRVGLSLKSQVRQQAEVLSKRQTSVVRERRRVLEPVIVEQGVTTAAYVQYLKSESAHDGSKPAPDPIAGKTYYCRRVGEQIRVQTRDGKNPPRAEVDLVAENMETLGKPNPLAEYLAGKSVTVGEKLTLPAHIAQRLLGLGGALGEVTKFELTLMEVSSHEGRECGVFQADIEAQRTDSSQMRLMIMGSMTIEAQACRAVASELSGPIGMSQSVNDPRGRLQLDSTGRIEIRVTSRLVNAKNR